MSDLSDDTNHLLLIPPDFFMADLANVSSTASDDVGSSVSKHAAAPIHLPHQNYKSQLRQHQTVCNHPNTADSSFRSYCPAGTTPAQFHHSTPKAAEPSHAHATTITTRSEDRNVIGEIDRFLSDNSRLLPKPKLSPEETLREFRAKCTTNGDTTAKARHSLFGGLPSRTTASASSVGAEPLLSLSAMWCTAGVTSSDNHRPATTDETQRSLHEERMRRTHCEQTIQQLQQTLLDREQKIAVALRVDRRKDEALAALRAELGGARTANVQLQQQLDGAVQRFADEHQLIDARCAQLQRDAERMQRDHEQVVVARRHLLECNELLEQKVAHGSRTAAEVRAVQQQQIDELTVRLKNSQRTAELAAEEVTTVRNDNQRLVADVERLQAAAVTVDQQRQQRERQLQLELDTQRASLKAFYQQQLNEAVARKLADFQLQVDGVEATLRTEARQRERLLAERAMRQMELIVQKNEQECALLSEKYAAEIELYRIRLAAAGQQIDGLQRQAAVFRAKRSDMAERLHTVMETQWHRALEILATSPKASGREDDRGDAEVSSMDASHRTQAESDSCQTPTSSRTMSTVIQKQQQGCRSLVGDGDTGGDADSDQQADKLQHYIELVSYNCHHALLTIIQIYRLFSLIALVQLLEKSPRDVDRLRDLLRETKTNTSTDGANADKSRGVTCVVGSGGSGTGRSKQPWK